MTRIGSPARLRPPGHSHGSSPPPSGTGETPSSSADDVLRSRAAAAAPSDSSPAEATADAASFAVVATADVPVVLPIAQLVDRTVLTPLTAIMQGPPPNAGAFGVARYAIDSLAGMAGVVMGAISLPGQLLDTGIASLSSALVPPGFGFPAACAGATLHIGLPHTHIPPPAPPVILPSIGDATGPGCLTVMINGMPSLRAGDIGFAPTCGSAGVLEIITGSASVFINGKRAARAMDMTRVCNPLGVFSAMAAMSAAMSGLDLAMAALPVVQGIAGVAAELETQASATGAEAEAAGAAAVAQGMNAAMMAAQAAADIATNVLRNTVGVPPSILPPAPIVLGMLMPIPMGPPVLIGGIPVPPLGDMLNFGIAQRRQRMRERRARPHGDDADARPRPQTNDDQNQCAAGSGCPIDAVTGAMYDGYLDFQSNGLFRFERAYSSHLAVVGGPIGRGYRHTYQRELITRLHRCTYIDENGTEIRFPRFDPQRRHVMALGYHLERLTPERYRLWREDRPVMTFVAPRGSLRAQLMSLVESDAALAARGGNDKQILDLQYDERGLLTGIEESEGASRTRYRLALDRDGHIESVWRSNERTALVAYAYDRNGCLVEVRRRDGSRDRYKHDVGHRVSERVDASGYTFQWRYDEKGKAVWSSGEDGLWKVSLEYAARTTTVTNANGGKVTYHFRADGIITKIVDQCGGVHERLVDGHGRVLREISPSGAVTELLYDDAGAVVGRRDPFGFVLPSMMVDAKPPNPRALRLPTSDRGWLLGIARSDASDAYWHLPAGLRAHEWALVPPPASVEPRRVFDELGRVIEEIDGRGRVRRTRLDGLGRPVEETDRDGRTRRWRRGRWSLVLAEEGGLGTLTRFRHTETEAIAAVADPNGSLTEYEYDLRGRLARVRRHGGVHVEYAYDVGDRLLCKRDGQGRPLATFTPHDNGYPARIDLASGGSLVFEYDSRGRVRAGASTSHDGRTLAFACRRDARGRVLSDLRDGEGVVRTQLGRERTRTVLFGRFALEEQSRAGGHTVVGPSGAREELSLRPDLRVERQLPNGTLEVSQYDEEGLLTGRVTHKRASDGAEVCWGVRYERSGEGDLHGVWDSARGPVRYELDAAHRLVGVDRHGVREHIELDAAGNVLSKQGLSRVELMEGNRVVATAEEEFVYDERQLLAGRRRRSDGRFTRYAYDSVGQLVRVEWRDATGMLVGEPWTANYDVLGRRVRFGRGAYQTALWWDGLRIGAEEELVVASGPNELPETRRGRLRIYVYPSIDALVPSGFVDYASRDAAPESGTVYQVFTDPTGLPLSIEDARGESVWWATATHPYGDVDIHPSSRIDYAMRWAGHRLDAALGLFYNRFRDYDPTLARYLQTDPIGQRGGINVYAYSSNPLKDVDLLGLNKPCASNPAATGETGDATARPLTEGAPESRDERRARLRAERGLDADGLSPAQRAEFNRLRAADPWAARRYRYEQRQGNFGDTVAPYDSWRRQAEQNEINQRRGAERERSARRGLGEELGRPLEDGNANPTLFAGDGTRPDSFGRDSSGAINLVHDHKHLGGTDLVLNNSPQFDAQRELLRNPDGSSRGPHVVTISSSDPTRPPRARPSAPLARESRVYFADSRGNVTHVWRDGAWRELR